jgi:hypothetical protein
MEDGLSASKNQSSESKPPTWNEGFGAVTTKADGVNEVGHHLILQIL